MVNEITLTKGNYSVTVYATDVTDNFKNKLTAITPPVGKQTQNNGPKSAMLVDLLRVTRTIGIKGYIISNTVKSNLIALIKGAKQKGGTITMTYENGGDSVSGTPGTDTSYTVLIETCTISDKAMDEPHIPEDMTALPTDLAKFLVDITVLEGTAL